MIFITCRNPIHIEKIVVMSGIQPIPPQQQLKNTALALI
jgi:hypothetical protein